MSNTAVINSNNGIRKIRLENRNHDGIRLDNISTKESDTV